MTREEAIARLHACADCGRWITVPACDHCYVDRMPPSVEVAAAALERAVALGHEAAALRERLRALFAPEAAG